MSICRKCSTDFLGTRCHVCYKKYLSQYYQNNKDKYKRESGTRKGEQLKRLYNITREDWDNLYTQQKGCCAICKQPELVIDYRTKTVRTLAVDHCHVTGKVRGLLCTQCNRAIGLLKDNISVLENAISYLEEN